MDRRPGVTSVIIFIVLALVMIPVITFIVLHSSEVTRLLFVVTPTPVSP